LVNSVVLIHIGKVEVEKLRKQDAIAQEYLLKYDSPHTQHITEPARYFW
jgi:hypothetical protein